MLADSQPFDLSELSRRIDQKREERGLTMTSLSGEVGVAVSTIRRFRTASDAEADGVLALIAWLGDPPEDFMIGSALAGAPLPPADGRMIRVDMDLVAKTMTGRHGAHRTTIQRLAQAAQASGKTVASLTRRSEV